MAICSVKLHSWHKDTIAFHILSLYYSLFVGKGTSKEEKRGN